jgi:L-seryl-tRNA(Ser) seleniumtransferase
MSDNPLRRLPSVNAVLESAPVRALEGDFGRDAVLAAVRQELEGLRHSMAAGGLSDGGADPTALAARVAARLSLDWRPRLRAVINATGIVLHTNLGRAPVAEAAARAAYDAAVGYVDLELDLATGRRSSRQGVIKEWVCRLTGSESATAVNNNAAATVIALRALCRDREVVVSRGQLVEIGGSFRIPEIMAVSGARLREVGTTNITRLADYERAVGTSTGALMRIHPSNYRIAGFTQSVPLVDLVVLGRKHGVPVIDDIGSGALFDFGRFGFLGEPVARHSVDEGADLVLFSGDKLLGGPQAGVLAGRRELIDRVERDPLMRAFRLDKMTLAALEATLRLYLHLDKAVAQVPVLRMLALPETELRKRAESLAARLRPLRGVAAVHIADREAFVGGGSLPEQALKSWVLEIRADGVSEEDLALRLRAGTPAVLGRVSDGCLVIDLRTVFVHQEEALFGALSQAVAVP